MWVKRFYGIELFCGFYFIVFIPLSESRKILKVLQRVWRKEQWRRYGHRQGVWKIESHHDWAEAGTKTSFGRFLYVSLNAWQIVIEHRGTMTNRKKLNIWTFLFELGNRAALKGLLISTVLTSLSQVTAITCLIVYAVKTFQLFGTFKNPYTPSIILATTLIVGSLTSSYLADKIGRKMLNLISLLLTAAGLLVTALFYYLNLDHRFATYSWVPVVSWHHLTYFKFFQFSDAEFNNFFLHTVFFVVCHLCIFCGYLSFGLYL